MSVQKSKTLELVEKFDELFGIDIMYRPDNGYDLSEGMVSCPQNHVALVFNPDDVPEKYNYTHEQMNDPVSEIDLDTKYDELFKVELKNGDRSFFKEEYLENIRELYGVENLIETDGVKSLGYETSPIRIDMGDTFVMIAPMVL